MTNENDILYCYSMLKLSDNLTIRQLEINYIYSHLKDMNIITLVCGYSLNATTLKDFKGTQYYIESASILSEYRNVSRNIEFYRTVKKLIECQFIKLDMNIFDAYFAANYKNKMPLLENIHKSLEQFKTTLENEQPNTTTKQIR